MKGMRITGTMHDIWKMLQLIRYGNEGMTVAEWIEKKGGENGKRKAENQEKGA